MQIKKQLCSNSNESSNRIFIFRFFFFVLLCGYDAWIINIMHHFETLGHVFIVVMDGRECIKIEWGGGGGRIVIYLQYYIQYSFLFFWNKGSASVTNCNLTYLFLDRLYFDIYFISVSTYTIRYTTAHTNMIWIHISIVYFISYIIAYCKWDFFFFRF